MLRHTCLVTVACAAAAASLLLGTGPIAAQGWPDKPVKVIVPYAAGGASDAIARPWCEEFSKAFGQQFVIENRGGASGMIGVEALAKSPPDGYTLIMTPNAPLTILPSLRKTPYDPKTDLVPMSFAGETLNGFVIHPKIGVKNWKEFVEYAKQNPGKLSYASSGNGTANHLRLEAIKVKLGLDILHVPYRGGADALNDVLPGNVHMQNEPITLPHAKAGKLILLAINGQQRNPDFPDVPTLTEVGVEGADVPTWFGFFAPKGIAPEVVAKLNAKANELAKSEEFKKKLWTVNAIVQPKSAADVVKIMADDTAANAAFIKAGNIKLE